jgi:hypothetical protein
MAKDPGTTRAPRGTKPVVAAFFSALNEVPETQRAAVAKAAVASIRNEISANRNSRAKAKAPAKTIRKTAASVKQTSPKQAVKAASKKPGAKVAAKKAAPAMKKTASTSKQKGPRKKAASKRPALDDLAGHSGTDPAPPEESV